MLIRCCISVLCMHGNNGSSTQHTPCPRLDSCGLDSKTVLGIFELILLFKAVLCCVLHSGLMKEYVQCSVSRGCTVWEISYTVAVSVILLMGIMHLNFPAVGVHSGH